MGNQKLVAISLVLALFGAGCSSGMQSASSDDQTVVTTNYPTGSFPGWTGVPGTTGTVTVPTGTNTVGLNIVSTAEMANYAANPYLSLSSGVSLTVNMQHDSRNLYYGSIAISYKDGAGNAHSSLQAAFSGQNVWLAGGGVTNKLWADEYNYWRSNTTFSAFLQDQFGGVVLVINGSGTPNTSGDGVGADNVLTGEIWYRNFAPAVYPQGPDRECWFITNGPFQCGSTTMINGSLQPTDSYRLLGTFSGLSETAAFGN